MINAQELFSILNSIPDSERPHIGVYFTSKDVGLGVVKDAKYDETATCSGGVIIEI